MSRYESFPCAHNLGKRAGQVWRDNSRRVRTHEKNSRKNAVRGLGTKIENIFVPNQESAFALIFGNGLVKVGTKGLLCLCYSRLFSRADSTPWVFTDASSSFCIVLFYIKICIEKHILALFRPPDFLKRIQTRQFACKFN